MSLRVSGGRRLQSPPGALARPTAARVRLAVINRLAPRLAGCRWLDLCCGSGAMACEALHHGAALVVGVEQDRRIAAVARANLETVAAGQAPRPSVQVVTAAAPSNASGSYKTFSDPLQACAGADLVTTDVWTSMGFEAENEARRAAFASWCVDRTMMAAAAPDALFMHCLPAHRGEEVEAEVIDGPQSVVWDEAENRMHVQKALMEYLLLGRQN